jgi:hypothetical protein
MTSKNDNTIGAFDYNIYGERRAPEGEIDIGAHVYICLKNWASDHGNIFISEELRSESQIDTCIANLKADLDAVGVCAKARFTKAMKRES